MSDIYGGSTRFYPRGRDAARSGLPLHTFDDQAGFTGISLHHGLPLARHQGMPLVPSFDRRARRQLLLKRLLLDIPMSAMALLVLSPLFLLIAVAIRLGGRGPIIFRQVRVGLDGEDFTLFKFRTIAVENRDETGSDTVVADQVTPIGRLLRATSLDELPQLWNILVGDMAVIGRWCVASWRPAGTIANSCPTTTTVRWCGRGFLAGRRRMACVARPGIPPRHATGSIMTEPTCRTSRCGWTLRSLSLQLPVNS